MKITINNKEYEITFVHKTECIIKINNENCKLATIKLYHKDKFDRNTGRKLALSKAISGFAKDIRTQIWQQYNKKYLNSKTEKITKIKTDSKFDIIQAVYEILQI